MSAGLLSQLGGLVSTSETSDYAVCGYHHKHQAERSQILAVAEAGASAGYILEMLTCEDRREDAQAMRLCYAFNALAAVDRHLVQVDIPAASKTDLSYSAPTITGVYGAANWFEREVFDMYGVVFDGHPDLERILLPEDADFFALRRDFGRMDEAEAGTEGQEEAEASDD